MNFDFIIVGGGMVGAAMACALQDKNRNIALIDSTPLNSHEDHRLIALNYSSISLLKNLNIWLELLPYTTSIQKIHVSHRGHFGATRLSASDVKLPYLGYVIPAKHINTALYENFKHVTLIRPATLTTLEQDEKFVTIKINSDKSLTTRYLLAADGTHSTVRKLLNIETTTTDYQQTALVTQVQLSRSHNHIAYERFQEQGAIAMLPLLNNQAAMIWTAAHEQINFLKQLPAEAFLELLQKQFGYRLGKLLQVSERYSYPLQMVKATHKVKNRILLLGNAAHTLHPIAAQGFNLALFEVAALRDYFTEHNDGMSCQRTLASSENFLDASLRWHDTDLTSQRLDNFAAQQQNISMQLSHHLSWIFSQDFFPLNTARKLGMIGLDLCQPLKQKFIRQTLGQIEKLPALLREKEFHETPTR